MRFTGGSTLTAPPEKVWEAILDPAALARSIPGCNELTPTGQNQYAMSVTAGVAAIKGTYTGTVGLSDLDEPKSLTMKASGSGAPGTIDADVRVTLNPGANGGTDISYDADATVGGAIGGVGQRMLAGVSKKMAGQFFQALDQDIAGYRAPVAAPSSVTSAGGTVAVQGVPVAAEAPAVYGGRTANANARASLSLEQGAGFAAGVLLGAALSLAGVLIGARIARRDGGR